MTVRLPSAALINICYKENEHSKALVLWQLSSRVQRNWELKTDQRELFHNVLSLKQVKKATVSNKMCHSFFKIRGQMPVVYHGWSLLLVLVLPSGWFSLGLYSFPKSLSYNYILVLSLSSNTLNLPECKRIYYTLFQQITFAISCLSSVTAATVAFIWSNRVHTSFIRCTRVILPALITIWKVKSCSFLSQKD